MKLRFLAFFVIFSTSLVYSRTATFSIYSTDHKLLGSLKVISTESDDTTIRISVTGQFNVKLLFTVAVRYTLTTVFQNNELYSGEIHTYRNNELHTAANTIKAGSQYKFTKDGEVSIYSERITFSEALLYFNEPINHSSLYSEFDGVEKSVYAANPGHYKIKNPLNGNFSEYFYEDGVLKAALVNLDLMMLYIEKN